jgi:hypothetical protein
MDELWHGKPYTLPFLYLGSARRIMFPERGRSVPFTIRNYAYVDEYGRETVTWIRNFATRKPRRFDAYMIFSQQRGRIVDTSAHTSTSPSISIYLSMNEADFASGLVRSVSTRVGSISIFPCCSPASQKSASGTRRRTSVSTSK